MRGDSEDEDEEHDDDEEEWSPPPKSSKGRSTAKKAVASPPTKAKSGSKPKSSGVTEIQKKMDVLSLFADEFDDTDKSLSTSHVDDTEEHIPKPKRLVSLFVSISQIILELIENF